MPACSLKHCFATQVGLKDGGASRAKIDQKGLMPALPNRSGKPCQFFPFGIKRSDDSNGRHERVNQSFEAVSMDLS